MQNGLGGRYYKTRNQVDKRIAQIIGQLEGLISTTTGTRKGKPTLTWARNQRRDRRRRPNRRNLRARDQPPRPRLTAGHVLRSYKGQQIVERRHRDYKQTLKVRPIFLHNDDRIYALTSIVGIALLIFGLIETELRKALDDAHTSSYPACCPKAAPPNPPDATCSPPSKDSASPTPAPASASTASPTPNAASSSCSRSPHPGPSNNQQT